MSGSGSGMAMLGLLLAVCSWGCGVQQLDVLRGDGGRVEDTGSTQDAGRREDGGAEPDAGAPPLGRSVSAGDGHTCAIWDGVLFCWGVNDDGQLGDPGVGMQLEPHRVPGDQRWIEVEVSQSSSCALDDTRQLWCWGDNGRGQLGQGDLSAHAGPQRVLGDVMVAAPGAEHGCAIDRQGTMHCWGDNDEGQLGLDAPGDFMPEIRTTPTPLALDGWLFARSGQAVTCGIRSDETLFCWGRNSTAQLGFPADVMQRRFPTQVDDRRWSMVAPGQNHSCGLDAAGALWCWGANAHFNLGNGSMRSSDTPERVDDGPYVDVDTDTFHGAAVGEDGLLYGWGRNIEGQLGFPFSMAELTVPTPLATEIEGRWAEVSTGRFHTCARREDGAVFCTGANEEGKLGIGSTDRPYEFTEVAPPLR